MKNWLMVPLIAIGVVFGGAFATGGQVQANSGVSFECRTSTDGVPTTMAVTERGSIPLIRFISNYFSESGWNPQRRCDEIASRFQTYNSQGTLKYFTTGQKNGYPALCVVKEQNGGCLDLLITLKKGDDPNAPLRQLLELRDRGNSGPLIQAVQSVSQYDRQGTLYIDIEKFLQTAPVE